MPRPAFLESFELNGAPSEPRQSGDWLDGHTKGKIEGAEEALSNSSVAAAELSQILADMKFSYEEACAHIQASLQPLFAALVEQVLPAMVDASMRQHLIAMIEDAAAKDGKSPMTLCINPAMLDALQPILPLENSPPLELTSDPALPRGRAYLRSGTANTVLDLDAFLSAVNEALPALDHEKQLRIDHG
ncbi:MAG: hypothetical protein JKX69_09165 [Rhodobacteraceae bacterium]|nr:hypothetical protein [Paracoccaceae bacterium]